MLLPLEEQESVAKLFEVLPLSRLEWMSHEEWYDDLVKVLEFSDSIRHPVAVIPADHSTFEECLQTVEHLYVALVLHDREFREYLNTGRHVGVP
jgi:hypothetical protein